MIGIRHKCLNRSFVGVLALVFMLALAACGGDDEDQASDAETQVETTETEAAQPSESETEAEDAPPPTTDEPTETVPAPSPEEQEGGAGDEEPAVTLALFTGENGSISPRVIRVPSFISIRVELRSGDGAEYGLTFGGETIKISDGLGSVSTTIDGLRPNEVVVGIPSGARGRVRIAATAEPGP